ncbi:hypothetical protein C1646_809335 [Rhizophagus diaphanus]|nr:hypothetical protein C1646_809335 [Rhizophagus diaphanus] [Rhizophagus sp. MUCL 43196]
MKFDRDVLYLISKNLRNDSISLYSFLLVSRIWCEVAVPVLWKIPGRIPLTKKAEKTYQPLSFNYIIFWRHLDLQLLEDLIKLRDIKKSNINIIINELLKLFINKNTKFLSLFIPFNFKYQLHNISWAEKCFSSLKFLHCDNKDKNVVEGLAIIAKSINKLIYHIIFLDDISGSLILIENQNNLNEIKIECRISVQFEIIEIIEKSLIKKADTIQHLQTNWDTEDEFLSYFVNLSSLKIGKSFWYKYARNKTNWFHLEKVSLAGLKVLIANIESHQNLDRMIKITNGHLHEITLCHSGIISDSDYNRRLIQAIYKNCPNLRYLNMPIKEQNFPEFERLLINCQNLSGLIFEYELYFTYESLFEILIRSSPISLYKFKIYFNRKFGPKFKLLKSFFDNWKDRHPMILQINMLNFDDNQEMDKLKELVKKYEVKGIVQRCDFDCFYDYEDFDWIRKKTDVYY